MTRRFELEPNGLSAECRLIQKHEGSLERKGRGPRGGPQLRTRGRGRELSRVEASPVRNETHNRAASLAVERGRRQLEAGRRLRVRQDFLETSLRPGGPQERRDALDVVRPHPEDDTPELRADTAG